VRIQCKCLVPIYVFPERKLLFPKQNYNVLSPGSYTHIFVRDLYISRIDLPILLQENMWTDPGNIQFAHRHMNVETGTEAVQFPEKEFINGIFLQCIFLTPSVYLLVPIDYSRGVRLSIGSFQVGKSQQGVR
jgi:hypothetical protein